MQGYVQFLKEDAVRATGNVATNRLRDARAKEVELRAAKLDRTVIDIEEAMAVADMIAGACVAEFEGLPARITRISRERERLREICDAARVRLADRFGKIRRDLETGRGELCNFEAEEDAG